MGAAAVGELVENQRRYFAGGSTHPVAFRLQQLKSLKAAIKTHEAELMAALHADLGKADFESYTSEVGFVYEEINYTLAHLRRWVKPQSVPTPLLYQPSTSRVYPVPKGVVLIIGPWNYPFQLLMAPLVGAISAGDCAVLKPSEIAPKTADVVARIIAAAFAPEFVAVVAGGVPETTALLAVRFDHIFFTGSIPVGKVVMRAAAEHLTPVTLELGGKSPCLVDEEFDFTVTARRIAWGKFFNAGQTCVAPDYLLVPEARKDELLARIKADVERFYGTDPRQSPDYGRIISDRHFERLAGFLSPLKHGKIAFGGTHDRAARYLAPTVVDGATMDDPLMEGEIFGPILPVMTYKTLDEALAVIRQRPNPLAFYLFTSRRATEERVIREVPFGGGCINNALVHLANPNLPFGGVGESGMGAYHGRDSFETFSHRKAVVRSSTMVDVPTKYPPYKNHLGLIRKLVR